MPTPTSYTREQILDAAMHAVHEHWRSATVAHVTARLGAPSGSIYHRFRSREALFASAWIRSIRRFHRELERVSAGDPVEAIVETALLIPRFCRENPLDARMMTAYRYNDLMQNPPPGLLAGLGEPQRPCRRNPESAYPCALRPGDAARAQHRCSRLPRGTHRPDPPDDRGSDPAVDRRCRPRCERRDRRPAGRAVVQRDDPPLGCDVAVVHPANQRRNQPRIIDRS